MGRPRQTRLAEPVGNIAVIEADGWPPKVLAAYKAACDAGDLDRRAGIIEGQTGEWPVSPASAWA